MGVRSLDPDQWIEVDEHRAMMMRAKDDLMRTRHADVFGHLPVAHRASTEALEMVIEHVTQHFPELHGRVGNRLMDRQTGLVTYLADWHPVEAAGRLVQEDLCVMVRQDEGWVLGAASLCFPGRWNLAEKLGRTMGGIHRPVPGYAERIAGPTDELLDKLRPDRPVWRLNWTLLDSHELFQPASEGHKHRRGDLEFENAGDQLHFRVERQTLRSLPVSAGILFTIRTYTKPLRTLVEAHPTVVADLAASLRSAPPELVAYRGWGPVLEAAVRWLEERG